MIARFLAVCRFLMVAPVIGSVVLTAAVVLMGIARMISAGWALCRAGELSARASKSMAVAVIEIIDLFLVATVAYITAVGLYKLFISDRDVELPMRIQIRTLKDLEDKIVGVIVAALGVAFLGKATSSDPMSVLQYGGGVALVIAALGIFVFLCEREPKADR